MLKTARLSATPYAIGLVASASRVRSSEFLTVVLAGIGFVTTPRVSPYDRGSSVEFVAATNTPPCFTKFCSVMSPCQAKPGRMSSVCASVPMFGVSGETFHGIGLRPHIGMPSISAERVPAARAER